MRTNFKKQKTNKLIPIPLDVLELLFEDPNPAEVISLFVFYSSIAIVQKTNIVECQSEIAAENLHWGVQKLRNVKLRLKEYGLVKDISSRIGGKITKHFIEIAIVVNLPPMADIPPLPSPRNNNLTALNSSSLNNINIYNINPPLGGLERGTQKFTIGERFPTMEKVKLPDFEKFKLIYPRNSKIGNAYSAWIKLCKKPDRPTWAEMRKAIIAQTDSKNWQKENGKYIPYPATWLNNYGWLNKAETSPYDQPEESFDTEIPDSIKNGMKYGSKKRGVD
jgi:hypothetical protein